MAVVGVFRHDLSLSGRTPLSRGSPSNDGSLRHRHPPPTRRRGPGQRQGAPPNSRGPGRSQRWLFPPPPRHLAAARSASPHYGNGSAEAPTDFGPGIHPPARRLARGHGALRMGATEVVEASRKVLAFQRVRGDERRMLCVFELAGRPAVVSRTRAWRSPFPGRKRARRRRHEPAGLRWRYPAPGRRSVSLDAVASAILARKTSDRPYMVGVTGSTAPHRARAPWRAPWSRSWRRAGHRRDHRDRWLPAAQRRPRRTRPGSGRAFQDLTSKPWPAP